MPGLRDHEPIVIEQFNGLWARGDAESAPSDHFTQADNIQYFNSGFETRPPIDKLQDEEDQIPEFIRVYNYVMQTGQSLIGLVEGGDIYHIIGATVHGPILSIPEMEDFGFVAISGRAYITPFKNYTDVNGRTYQLGIEDEFVYVYKGDGTAARKAAGAAPTGGALGAALGAAGLTDIGDHLFAVVYETDTGYLTALGPSVFALLNLSGTNKIDLSNIPVSGDSFVVKRHIVATKQIPEYNGDQDGYQFFFVPGGNIDNNTDTTKTVEFFDIDLLSDASHLIDNFAEIPSCVNLNTYHSRMVCVGEFGTAESLEGLPAGITDNRSVARVSHPGEPEAISQVDGLIIAPLDGNALTNCQEFRDILYLFKASRTFAYADNGDVPSSWQEETLDQGVGAPVHGIASVLDSGGVNTDFLLIADWSGLMLFNGIYARPEMSWKIENIWVGSTDPNYNGISLDRDKFQYIQIVNDSLSKKIWLTLPPPYQNIMLFADYGNGLDAKNIRWARWIFDVNISCCCLINTTKLVLGAISNVT